MKRLTKEDFRIVQESENTFYLEQRNVTYPDVRQPHDAHQNWERVKHNPTASMMGDGYEVDRMFKSATEAKDYALELINKSDYPKYFKL